ncbi:paladin isoform X1 [Pseudonaja textilis]|uniref:paladin isoform X1 n=2 Tax=Pseudonaja textilis TaxID=8673 RepID=UPI000EAA8BF9|nr:paladin isoform X1 [Pseudonaja textilis]
MMQPFRCLWIMGTTASTAQQTVATATFENIHGSGAMEDHHSLSIHSFQTIGLHNNKAKSIITNKVAPVVITYNCKEEFQIHDDLLKASYSVGRITESTPEHYLVQGKYFMVRDVYGKLDVLNTSSTCGAPNFRQAKGGYAVFGMGQPSFGGFKQVLQKLQNDGHKECIVFCIREEPILFLRMDNDFIPYTPRAKENLKENLHNLHRGVKVEDLEVSIRKEIHDFAQLSENIYYVYNDIERFKDEPHSVKIFCEEDIQVTEEVYKRPVFLLPSYRYHRLPLPVDGAPLETQFDAFIGFLRESPNLLLLQDRSKPPPALVFSCQTGVGTTNFAMVLGTLVLFHRKGGLLKQDLPQSPKSSPREQFRIIQNFIGIVPKGQQIVEEVDAAIALCSEMHDVKEAIYEYKRKLEGIGEDYQNQKNSTKERFLQKMLQRLECYFFLIAFNYYLHEQYPLAFALNFSRWICRHPELYRLQANMNLSELTITAEHITKGVRVLVVDERFSPDVLSTIKDMNVANFRRVPKMPVYGMAQPNSKAIGNVLNYLTDAKRKHSHILWINLREDIVLEENEQTYTLREAGNLEQQITVPVASSEQLEKLESVLKNDLLKSQKRIEVYLEQEKQTKMLKSCLTMQEIFNQHKSNCQGLAYKRIPVPDFCGPREKDFDQMLEAMKGALAEDLHTAFVFNCHSGRGRTTTAMVMAVLILWHFNGIPEIMEDEIVSVPDAKYTKGEFEVVMKVLQILPEGHRMKKEVDMALDTVSETMTPMHYHLREIIISTYRQGKTAKEEAEVQTLQLRSLQFLERYIYLILFNAYLHLAKKDSWEKPFSIWMQEVAAKAGVYEILNQLGFSEFETLDSQALSQLRYRWQEQSRSTLPFRGEFI